MVPSDFLRRLPIYLKTKVNRAVANGPVGPAMAGPIIEPANFYFYFLFS